MKQNSTAKASIESQLSSSVDLDLLLTCPDNPDGSEVLEAFEAKLIRLKKIHDNNMQGIDEAFEKVEKSREEFAERQRQNSYFKDRLTTEVTDEVIKELFENNKEHLDGIRNGTVFSQRHKAFHEGIKSRQSLFYTMVIHPFTDKQLQLTLDMISKTWSPDKTEALKNEEYVWKVLLAETFIKFYMDHFQVSKQEAEKRIAETPLEIEGLQETLIET